MRGCLARLGCLALIAVIGLVAFLTRDLWLDKLARRPAAGSSRRTESGWQAITPDGAERARKAMERLQSPRGPAYLDIAPGDLLAYITQELARTLPTSTDSIEAAAINDRVCVRAVVRISDLGHKSTFGPIAMLLGDRERLQMCGVLRIIRPGAGELQVKEFRIRDLSLPQPLIPRLIRQMSRGERPSELSPDGLSLRTPDYIGDVRVTAGAITLYKNVQAR